MSINWEEILSRYPSITGVHPAADIFPMMEGDDFQDLCADIKEHGLRQSVVVWKDGRLLDGRNRLMACHQAGHQPAIERYEGDDPVQFSLSANLQRRHLNVGQRAMVALRVEEIEAAEAKKRQGERTDLKPQSDIVANLPQCLDALQPPSVTAPLAIKTAPVAASPPVQPSAPKAREAAATAVNVSPRSVQMAKAVSKAAPDLADKVRAGAVPLHKAYREAQERQLRQPLPEEVKWSDDEMKRRRIVEEGGTVVANMHSGKDEFLLRWARSGERFVRIDRQSPFGNPYELPGDGDRDSVCDSFAIYFARKYSLHGQLSTLKGKVLGCWCYPERCHGEYLIFLIQKLKDAGDDV